MSQSRFLTTPVTSASLTKGTSIDPDISLKLILKDTYFLFSLAYSQSGFFCLLPTQTLQMWHMVMTMQQQLKSAQTVLIGFDDCWYAPLSQLLLTSFI